MPPRSAPPQLGLDSDATRSEAVNLGGPSKSGAVRVGLSLTVGVLLLGLPALAEADASARLEDNVQARLGSRPSVALDARGLHLYDLELRARGHALRVSELRVRPSLDGIMVHVGDAELRSVAQGQAQAISPPEATSENAAQASPGGLLSRLEPTLKRLRGVPVHVKAQGRWSWPERDLELVLGDTHATVGSDRKVVASLKAQVRMAETRAQDEARVELSVRADPAQDSAKIELAYLTGKLGRVDARVEMQGDRVAARVQHGDGRIEAQGHGLVERANAGLTLHAQAWKLDALAPLLSQLDLGSATDSLDLANASVDGEMEFRRLPNGVRAHLNDFSVHALAVDAARISPRPVTFARLSLDGDVSVTRDASSGARVVELSTAIAHGTVRMNLAGHVDPTRVDLDLELASMPCQGLLDSAPRGLLPALEGMRVSGAIEGQFGLHYEWDKVRDWATRSAAGEQLASPGQMSFALPVVERCPVRREAPGVDVAALQGAYRHRFMGEQEGVIERILGTGAPEFAPIASIPRVSRAFTILEDARFWDHDGFDIEHIERALWHDLGVGRFARGASTITQQTARNLWLGVDRSLGRKLQEAFLAARLEQQLDKRRIMEVYMNIIELGPNVYGVEAAANFYFGRPARDLNTIEALHLAAMAPSPVRYAKRFRRGEVDSQWRERLEEQVRRLRIHGFMNREQARAAKTEPLRLVDRH